MTRFGQEVVFFVHVTDPTTGSAADADSTPTAVFKHDGTTDAGVTVTMSSTGTTGEYKGAFTTPSAGGGYVDLDQAAVIVTATKTPSGGGAAVTARICAWSDTLTSKVVSDLNDAEDVSNDIVDIKAKTDNLPADPADASDIAAAFAAVPTAVWASGTRTLSSFGTLVSDIWHHLLTGITTAGSIGKLIKDYLDASITSRLASASYTAPDNASITAIKSKTDNLPANPASQTNLDVAVSTRLASASYAAPDNAGVSWIKVVTDKLGTMVEADGGAFRYTANALEQAPAGGGGGGTNFNTAVIGESWSEHSFGWALNFYFNKLNRGDPESPLLPIPAPPGNPELSTVFGYVLKGGAPVEGVELVFELVTPDGGPASAGFVVDRQQRSATTNADGLFSLSLEKTSSIIPSGSVWRVTSNRLKFRKHEFEVTDDQTDISDSILG